MKFLTKTNKKSTDNSTEYIHNKNISCYVNIQKNKKYWIYINKNDEKLKK